MSTRLLACAAVALLALLALAHERPFLGGAAKAPSAGPTAAAGSRAAVAQLPVSAQAAISADVGAELPSYRVHFASGALSASNPAQHLRLRFSSAGARIDSGALELGLRLSAVGRGTDLRALAPAAPSSHANRVSYAHPGVSEWYANGTLGLEQGFTVARDPQPGARGPLTLAIAASGDTTAAQAGQAITFSSLGGESLRYGELSATDAHGRVLPARMSHAGTTVLLSVDTTGASFPVRIDPIAEQDPEIKLVAEIGEHVTSFGRSLALSADGNTAIVGGPGGKAEAGAAWVFTHTETASGPVWTQQGKELPIPSAEGENKCVEEEPEEPGEEPEECGIGWSVALSADGNTALIGGPRALELEGAAWVFTREGSTWVAGPELNAPGGAPRGHFGRSVALSASGDTAIIGAPTYGVGRAYIFTRSGSKWSPYGEPLNGIEANGDPRFGRSVALSEDGQTALVGGPADGDYAGAAWAYTRIGGVWVLDGKKMHGTSSGAHYGFSVALSGDASTAAIGGYESGAGQGAVWLYDRSGSGYVQQGAPLAGENAEELFGYSVALSPTGSTVLVGAPRAASGRGAAWLFGQSGPTWLPEKELVGGVAEKAHARLGTAVALSADAGTLLIGGPRERSEGGAAWVFGRGPSVESVTPPSGPPAGGTTVTIAGEHLTGASEVLFGTTPASFTVESGKSITAVAPSGVGTVDVTVRTSNGLSATNEGDEFTYKMSSGKGPQFPSVSAVTPNEGSTAGGTTVTISGENLVGAKRVLFGATPAKSFSEGPGETLTAVTPAGTGTVDVTVETAVGTSTAKRPDRFTYVAPTSGSEQEGPAGKTVVLGSGPTSGGPLGSIAVAGCGVALLSKTLAVQPHSRAVLKLGGTGLGKCAGKVRLRVRIKLPHKRIGIKTIGTAVFAVLAGKHVAVNIHLNKTGRTMFASHHGRLNASVLIVRSTPAPSLARTASVRLRLQKPKPKPKKK